jgi:hypothetical protein
MTRDHFQAQMNRLSTRWRGTYVDELVGILWREVSTVENADFTTMIDELIGSSRQAPLVPEFREHASRARERQWQRDKRTHEQDAVAFTEGTYQPDDVRLLCQYVIRRMNKLVADADWASFVEHLGDAPRKAMKLAEYGCKFCDAGLVWEKNEAGFEHISRCTCAAGQRRPRAYPVKGYR